MRGRSYLWSTFTFFLLFMAFLRPLDFVDLWLLIPLAIITILLYFLVRPTLEYFHLDPVLEPIRRQLIQEEGHCNYCGYNKLAYRGFRSYCSISCMLTRNRHIFLIANLLLAVIAFQVSVKLTPIISTIGFILLPFTFFSLDEHVNHFTYRHVKNALSPPKISESGMIYLKQLDKQIKVCCFQTARLGERYCYCGRAVSQTILDVVESMGDRA